MLERARTSSDERRRAPLRAVATLRDDSGRLARSCGTIPVQIAPKFAHKLRRRSELPHNWTASIAARPEAPGPPARHHSHGELLTKIPPDWSASAPNSRHLKRPVRARNSRDWANCATARDADASERECECERERECDCECECAHKTAARSEPKKATANCIQSS